jgi:hypothetical protein
MVNAFIVVGWLIALGSVFAVSTATAGVGGICFACFLVITARVGQADRHHREVMTVLRTPPSLPPV